MQTVAAPTSPNGFGRQTVVEKLRLRSDIRHMLGDVLSPNHLIENPFPDALYVTTRIGGTLLHDQRSSCVFFCKNFSKPCIGFQGLGMAGDYHLLLVRQEFQNDGVLVMTQPMRAVVAVLGT